jgi:uncharacterized protein (DUF427 family)
MALALGTGPFGKQSTGTFNFEVTAPKGHVLYFEDCPKRVRAVFGGETVVDSRGVKILHETGHLPVYYFPEGDLNADLLEGSDRTTHCPFKGDADYRSVRVGDRVAENALWGYPEPLESAPPIAGYWAFYAEKMDRWLEEDEEVIGHPHDPYHRVDVLQSSRHVKVSVDGVLVAETGRPKVLFETGLPPRFYLPPGDVRTDLLTPSASTSVCPYKGVASYRSLEVGDNLVEDAAWYYPEPFPEAEKVKDHLCFYDEKVTVEVDG